MLTEAQSSVVRQFAQFLLILSEVFYKMVPFDTINLFKQLFVSSPKTLGSPTKMSSAFPHLPLICHLNRVQQPTEDLINLLTHINLFIA